ncbi:hypothetical protein SCHPADRAFT_519046 [Schizopora paradoxa]|uniref:Uncharacterized protein n=1 Tax=Schizopora paradoxa TaxID=27342 RepID=A0A0H2RLX9_9AGAM|nr:hypothetical protein SCHPADRAFT_519046 [Schizopora paradoxa]
MRRILLALDGLPFRCTISAKVTRRACGFKSAFGRTSSAAATRGAIGSSNRLLGHMNDINIRARALSVGCSLLEATLSLLGFTPAGCCISVSTAGSLKKRSKN